MIDGHFIDALLYCYWWCDYDVLQIWLQYSHFLICNIWHVVIFLLRSCCGEFLKPHRRSSSDQEDHTWPEETPQNILESAYHHQNIIRTSGSNVWSVLSSEWRLMDRHTCLLICCVHVWSWRNPSLQLLNTSSLPTGEEEQVNLRNITTVHLLCDAVMVFLSFSGVWCSALVLQTSAARTFISMRLPPASDHLFFTWTHTSPAVSTWKAPVPVLLLSSCQQEIGAERSGTMGRFSVGLGIMCGLCADSGRGSLCPSGRRGLRRYHQTVFLINITCCRDSDPFISTSDCCRNPKWFPSIPLSESPSAEVRGQ